MNQGALGFPARPWPPGAAQLVDPESVDGLSWAAAPRAVTIDPGTVAAASTVPAGSYRAIYERVHQAGLISSVGFMVATASGNVSVAVLRDGGDRPGRVAQTSPAVSCPSSGITQVSLKSPTMLYPGDWLALAADNTTATFRSINPNQTLPSWRVCYSDLGGVLAWMSNPPTLLSNAYILALWGNP